MVPLYSHKVPRVSWYSGSCCLTCLFAYGAFTLSGRLSQNRSAKTYQWRFAVRTPECTHSGLGSFHFARRYFGNRCFFLFLRLLRCFSSPGSPPYVMYWRMDDWSLSSRVSPFRYLRIIGYLLLPEAFRSLSRLSSALSAKASTLRSFLLDLVTCLYSVINRGPLNFFSFASFDALVLHCVYLLNKISLLLYVFLGLMSCKIFAILSSFLCVKFSRYVFAKNFFFG